MQQYELNEEDCDVADEDIQINSLSCERWTVNSQGILSMKDFQSMQKPQIFQRKLNKSQQAQRSHQVIRQSNNTQKNSFEKSASPIKGINYLRDAYGPVLNRPTQQHVGDVRTKRRE